MSVLENMLALRLHLDDAGEDNGALRVVPGSHRLGRLSAKAIAEITAAGGAKVCAVAWRHRRYAAALSSPLVVREASDEPA